MRYFLATLGFILLVVVVIVLLTGSGSRKATTGSKIIQIKSYAAKSDSQVRFTIDGPVIASENYRSVQITVSPTDRNLTVFQGYQGTAIINQSYPNNQQAYSAFLAALQHVDFTSERSVNSSLSRQSVCPTGNRSSYQILEANKTVMDLWSASCTSGSFAGNISLTSSLFRAQIPDYVKQTSHVSVTGAVSTSIF